MNCLKRICCLFLLFAITIALFAGCSSSVPPDTTITQPTEENTEPVTKTHFVARSSIPVIADFQDWLEEVLSQLEHPMTYFFSEATDCNGFDFYFAYIDSVTPSTPALRISVELDAENTYISEFVLSTVGKFNQTLTHEPTETDFSLFKQLGLAAFSHFYDDSFLADAETLLSLKPGETVYADAFDWTHPSISLTESDYYFSALYFDAYDNVYLYGPKDDADSYIRSLIIYPPVQANNASAKEIEDAANLVLAQAGIPAKFVFWGHDNDTFLEDLNLYYYYSLEYTGNGNDVYSDYLYGSLEYDLDEAAFTHFYINMRNTPTSETVDAMRNIFTAFAPVVSNDITDDFMTEFFALEAYRQETDSVYNRYGAEVEPLAANFSNERSPIRICYEANNEPNCIVMFFSSDSENPENNGGHIRVFENEDANKGTKTLPFYAFAERYPVYSELYSNYGDLITYNISDQATDDLPFFLRITLRLEDLAVESIRVSYNISEADDEETIAAIYERFQKIAALTLVACDVGITEEDVYEQLSWLDNPDYGFPFIGIRSDDGALQCEIEKHSAAFNLDIDITPAPSQSGTGNIYVDLDLLPEPPVVDGKFSFLQYKIGIILYYYFNEKTDYALDVFYVGDLPEKGEVYAFSGPIAFNDYLDHFNLTVVHDSNPHFEMTYNMYASQLFGLDDGYYFIKGEQELLLHYPIALALLCDSDMSEGEAKTLFNHTIAPTVTEDDITLTMYSPREVVHILISNSTTGNNRYFVMTKQDFDDTYGNLDAFLDQF